MQSPNRQVTTLTASARRWTVALLMVVVIGIAWLLREHWGHLLGWSPYLLLFACPLMHLFMHHDQHHHNGESHRPDAKSADSAHLQK